MIHAVLSITRTTDKAIAVYRRHARFVAFNQYRGDLNRNLRPLIQTAVVQLCLPCIHNYQKHLSMMGICLVETTEIQFRLDRTTTGSTARLSFSDPQSHQAPRPVFQRQYHWSLCVLILQWLSMSSTLLANPSRRSYCTVGRICRSITQVTEGASTMVDERSDAILVSRCV